MRHHSLLTISWEAVLEGITIETLLGALLIFAMRIVDVSLGTLRIGMLVRGKRGWAGLLSFFESLVWLVAAARVLGNLESPLQFVAYAGGYATGTMLGSFIEKWLAVGQVVMRVIYPVGAPDIQTHLREAGFYVTALNASGRDGEVQVLFSVMKRRRVQSALDVLEQHYPKAFVTIEEVTTAHLQELSTRQDRLSRRFRMLRK